MSTGVVITRKARIRPPMLRVSAQVQTESLNSATYETQDQSRSIYQITPSIFISGYEASKNITNLESLKITHILNLAGESKCPHIKLPSLTYYSLKMPDNPKIDIQFFIYFSVEYIKEALQSQGKILIHCVKGTSRAATVILAYLILQGFSETEAYDHLIRSNPNIDPNLGFMCQLKDLGKQRSESRTFWYSSRYDMLINTPNDQGCKIELFGSHCNFFINDQSTEQEKSRTLFSVSLWEKFNNTKASIM